MPGADNRAVVLVFKDCASVVYDLDGGVLRDANHRFSAAQSRAKSLNQSASEQCAMQISTAEAARP